MASSSKFQLLVGQLNGSFSVVLAVVEVIIMCDVFLLFTGRLRCDLFCAITHKRNQEGRVQVKRRA